MEQEIIVFGKSEEMLDDDRRAGLARIGGAWRTPCYLRSYACAAKTLFQEAERTSRVDELALPILYLARHTTELALKQLRDNALEISEYQCMIEGRGFKQPSNLRTHNWNKLITQTSDALQAVSHTLPEDLKQLAVEIDNVFEKQSPERARYRTIRSGQGKQAQVASLAEEVAVPIRHLLASLEQVMKHFGDDPSLAFSLYCQSSALLQRIPPHLL